MMTAVLAGPTIPLMSTLAERLQQVMVLRGISASKLSLDANLSRTTVQKIIDRGGPRTSADTISKLADAARVSREWLESGRGSIEVPSDVLFVARPELQVARDEQRVPEDDEVPVETALFAVYAAFRKDYVTADFEASRTMIREAHRKTLPNADLEGYAKRLLDAAKRLRIEGIPATSANIAWHLAAGKTPRGEDLVREVSDAYNAEADESLRAKGLVPGAGAANVHARIDAMRKRKARDD